MIKHTVTYLDFNGNEKTEDLYFHFSKTDAVTFVKNNNSLLQRFQKTAVDTNTDLGLDQIDLVQDMVVLLNDLIHASIGSKSQDGSRFIRFYEDNRCEAFFQSAAYEALFDDLISDENKLTSFVTELLGPVEPSDSQKLPSL